MAKKLSKVSALDAKDLDMLKQYVEALNKITAEVGSMEVKKGQLLGNHGELSKEFQTFSEGIQFKYGKIQIDIQTGEYKTEEEIEAEKEVENGPNKEN